MNLKVLNTEIQIACDSDKRADMELTDDTVAKRVKLFDTPSSSSSSHEIAEFA